MSKHVDQSTRLLLKLMAAGAVATVTGCATRDPSQPPEEGFDYRASASVWPGYKKGQLEVSEFFWYACPFCNAFEPILLDWHEQQPDDVSLVKVHPWPNKGWLLYSQLHWTLVEMGKAKELSAQIYSAIHDREVRLDTRDDVIDLIEGLEVESKAFLKVFDSASVKASMDKANEMAKFFKLDGVPALVVNGRWYTSPTMAGSRERALQIVDFLLARARRGG